MRNKVLQLKKDYDKSFFVVTSKKNVVEYKKLLDPRKVVNVQGKLHYNESSGAWDIFLSI